MARKLADKQPTVDTYHSNGTVFSLKHMYKVKTFQDSIFAQEKDSTNKLAV